MLGFINMKVAAVVVFFCGLAPYVASAEVFVAALSGKEEVPANTTVATGHFLWNFNSLAATPPAGANAYTLRYMNLEGTVTMAHIHVGQAGVNGGITIWLCETAGNPAPPAVAAATPDCPLAATGQVNGTITPGQVLGIDAQRVTAGDLNEVVMRALRTGNAYVNVHTSVVPGGEIRGQIR